MRTLYDANFTFQLISHHRRVTFAVKNIVLTGFGNITLLDLDTIDLSNLNRQFLFRKKDVKQSKALVSVHISSLVLTVKYAEDIYLTLE